jgi:dipeptidyl aminopeptidase/acylaminoacyl peptidase
MMTRSRAFLARWGERVPVKLINAVLASCVVLLAATESKAASSVSDSWHVAAGPEATSEEIRFSNGSAHLVGTLYLPTNGDHLPAVVALHSAVAATRDSGLYRHLRDGLPAMGFAVLIYDRRGSGESSGDRRSSDFEALADDAIAGQHVLAKHPRIDPKKIGFWGLSQGGWLAVLAAGRSPDAAFAISISAPLVNADEQMRFAMSNLLAVRGYGQSDVRDMLEARKAWTDYLHKTNSQEAAVNALRNVETKPWFSLVYLPKASQLSSDSENEAARREFDDDPVSAVRKTKVPLLFLYGDSDPWVPVAKSLERLQSLRGDLPNIEYAVIRNANHEMMAAVNETMEVNQATVRDNEPQAPTYFILLGSWLSRRFPK